MTEPRYCTHGDEGVLVYVLAYDKREMNWRLAVCCYECNERLVLPKVWFCFPIAYQKTVSHHAIVGKGIQLRY